MLDVLRGVVVLRSLGASGAGAEASGRRRAVPGSTVETLRPAFSGLVLEFVAMLGTALVAVVGGVRLAKGRRSSRRRCPPWCWRPSCTAPASPRRGAHGRRRARNAEARGGCSARARRSSPRGRPGAGIPDPGACAIGARRSRRPPARRRARRAQRPDDDDRAAVSRRDRRTERRRQVEPCCACCSRSSSRTRAASAAAAGGSRSAISKDGAVGLRGCRSGP